MLVAFLLAFILFQTQRDRDRIAPDPLAKLLVRCPVVATFGISFRQHGPRATVETRRCPAADLDEAEQSEAEDLLLGAVILRERPGAPPSIAIPIESGSRLEGATPVTLDGAQALLVRRHSGHAESWSLIAWSGGRLRFISGPDFQKLGRLKRTEGFMRAWSIEARGQRLDVSIPVYREGDGGCCPSGGSLQVELALPPSAAALRVVTVTRWLPLADGLEYATFPFGDKSKGGDGLLHVVRVDPRVAPLRLLLASERRSASRTAAQWADEGGLTVAINAGMFATDQRSNVGHLRNGAHFNNPRWNPKYHSALAFDRQREDLPAAALVDLESGRDEPTLEGYAAVLQNLRTIKGDGDNVWRPNGRAWSEAAVAADGAGRVLFLFARTPHTVFEFNRRVLALPLGIVRAMHAEGGPEASLSIRSPELNLDLCGSYETGFHEDDDNDFQWPIPNVLGAAPKNWNAP